MRVDYLCPHHPLALFGDGDDALSNDDGTGLPTQLLLSEVNPDSYLGVKSAEDVCAPAVTAAVTVSCSSTAKVRRGPCTVTLR